MRSGPVVCLLAGCLLAGGFGLNSASAAPAQANTRRVDLAEPTFSKPTAITNPLFPKATLGQVVQLGAEGEERLRFEATQLEETSKISWKGRQVETLVTHFVAYSNGRLKEVATDYYAQADDGSVWYFGEQVDNYEEGVIANHDGTWLAGRDGPPGMIMPAKPKVGDVYRPENIPGVAFEEATVTAVDLTLPGPRGPVTGGMAIEAVLLDGTVENKVYAPGYGEFRAQVVSADELYNVALAVPIDARPGPVPTQLTRLSAAGTEIFWTAPSKRWDRISSTVERMRSAWAGYPPGAPPLLTTRMKETLDALGAAVAARNVTGTRQAAIDVGMTSLDLQLRSRPPGDIDEARLRLWRNQLTLDRSAHDRALVAGDMATIKAIENRTDD